MAKGSHPLSQAMYMLINHDQSINYSVEQPVDSARTAMYEILEFVASSNAPPARSWRMRNALGRIVGGGEFGTFTSECDAIINEQHCATPLMIIFDNGLCAEVIREEEY